MKSLGIFLLVILFSGVAARYGSHPELPPHRQTDLMENADKRYWGP
jgi:hypothetical protein